LTLLRPRDKSEKPVDDIGDILACEEYFAKPPDSLFKTKTPYLHLGIDGWTKLNKMSIDCLDLKPRLRYACPWTKNQYCLFYPALLFAPEIDSWMSAGRPLVEPWHVGSWDGSDFDDNGEFKIGSIIKSFMGHGYTDGTLPDDGSGYTYSTVIYTTCPGVMVAGRVWVWYNK
jgi:hypothetical protein